MASAARCLGGMYDKGEGLRDTIEADGDGGTVRRSGKADALRIERAAETFRTAGCDTAA